MSKPSGISRPRLQPEKLEKLFRDHHEAVLAYARRRASAESVEDVVAETFLVAWRRLDEVPMEKARPWLLGVARKVLANEHRGVRRRRALGARLLGREAETNGHVPEADEPLIEPGEPSCLNGRDGSVAAALAQLADKDREALELIAWEGLRPSEAAAVLGDSPGAFRVRLHRARGRLKRALEDPRTFELSSDRSPLPKENV